LSEADARDMVIGVFVDAIDELTIEPSPVRV
jgi:hypothetical protein